MMTTQFHDHMNCPAAEIRQALGLLEQAGRIKMTKVKKESQGRPSERWERVET